MLITIGAFDGFHKGHAQLLKLCRDNADKWAVVSFFPHPSEFMKKFSRSLFTLREREILRKVLDVPEMLILKFDDDLKNLSPSEFWNLIRKKFQVDAIVMGRDFHFGRENSGSAETLKQLAESDGVKKIIIADLKNKPLYSSSLAREKISHGNISCVNNILGYPFFMMGEVIKGSQRGRTMNFPTANLKPGANKIIPAYGVYSVCVLVKEKFYAGALSISNNPTFKDINETRIETNILDFNEEIYGSEIILFFLERIRDIKTFPDKDILTQQINNDVLECKKFYDAAFKDLSTKKFLEKFRKIYIRDKDLSPEIINLVGGIEFNK